MLDILFRRTNYALVVFVLVFSISLLKGCNSTPPEYEAFFAQDWDTQRQQAKGFPIEKQIDYYLAGRRYFHPPYSTLLYIIAEKGKEALPPLLEKMRQAGNDSDRMDLLEVVLNIHEFHASLSDDKVAIDQLSAVVARITDPTRKAQAEAMLKDIVDNRRRSTQLRSDPDQY